MFRIGFLLSLLLLISPAADNPPAAAVAPPPYENFMLEAYEAKQKGLLGKAQAALEKAIKLNPTRVDAHFRSGQVLSLQRKSVDAIEAYTKVIQLDPKASSAYQGRGLELLKLGEIEKAITDFNQYIALEPKQEPYHWQRGIAFYYAGKFAEGRKQFESHQTVNRNDVENGVWHFLCAARLEGFDKAQKAMLPIVGDPRVPMTEIYELFAGRKTVEDVLLAIRKGEPSELELETRRFYGELYLGLYHEAKSEHDKAYQRIRSAATDFVADHYMGDLARVHFRRLLTAKAAGK